MKEEKKLTEEEIDHIHERTCIGLARRVDRIRKEVSSMIVLDPKRITIEDILPSTEKKK